MNSTCLAGCCYVRACMFIDVELHTGCLWKLMMLKRVNYESLELLPIVEYMVLIEACNSETILLARKKQKLMWFQSYYINFILKKSEIYMQMIFIILDITFIWNREQYAIMMLICNFWIGKDKLKWWCNWTRIISFLLIYIQLENSKCCNFMWYLVLYVAAAQVKYRFLSICA